MNISELFITRPVTTTLLQVAIVIFGIVGYRALPVSDLPTVDFPTIAVNAGLPGASPETMAAAVATPLEKQFSSIAGIASISSTSSQGSTSITLQFDLDRSIDAAAQDVESAIAKTLRQLPPNMPAPPSYQKVNPADSPILYLTLSSKMLPLSQVDEYAETLIGQRISMVSGVALVSVFGAQKYAVRLDVDPYQLAARAIGIDALAQAVQSANVNQPTGTLYGPDRTFTVNTSGQLTEAAAYRHLIVAYRSGRPVRLDDVATVYDGIENDKTASWYNGDRAIYLSVQRQPGSNTVEIVDSIRALLPQLQTQLPASVQLLIRNDRSQSIRDSVDDVKFTLVLTVALVVLVIFLFLRNLSATLIPSLALPASIVGTFAVMALLGYSLDNLSLMALTLSGRLRRRRRDRDAGEHRPAHGTRRRRDDRGAQWIEGDRLHDHLDDRVAGGGVHPDSLHGRHRRPPAARIRGHDRRRDRGVRAGLDQPDADAGRAFPEAAAAPAARRLFMTIRSTSSTRACGAMPGPCGGR